MHSVRTIRSRSLAAAAIASIGILGLAGCSTASEEPADETEQSAAPEPSESEESEAPAAEGQPAWANPVTEGGELISTIELDGGITVEVYQVGTTAATKTGQFVDPDTNEPIIDEGDEIVFVNYVVSNAGDPVDLGSSLVSVDARYDDWPYMQGMDSVVDDALFEEQGVNTDALADGAYVDPSVYTLGTGEQYSYGENFPYQADSPITFDVSVTPVDAEGELLHDDRIEAEGTGTIA
ncbi:hypothetical protein CLV49_1800 [Labedella gwakjiensis]|uniref:Peptidylprolyl isomerase n=1 Tax=Labedella gwakjiensis TaxID=390269 RepID=A0A2P8GW57_9MICO|nr:hypothetical protein [Labedella gwakjiensis]PSL38185.1 hypothetical protein CLV49_1800 [Labedella gwakjiensis]